MQLPPIPTLYQIKKHWQGIDISTLFTVIGLIVFSLIISISTGPAIAERINASRLMFVKKHMIFIIISLGVMAGWLVVLDRKRIYKIHFLLFGFLLLMMGAVLIFGAELKGAKRWLDIGGFTLQPSEIMKPSFIVINAIILAYYQHDKIKQFFYSSGLLALIVGLLLLQPDVGMSATFCFIWLAQIFIAGVKILFFLGAVGLLLCGIALCYLFLPHFRVRINKFFVEGEENYQIVKGLQSIQEGGIFGKGIGSGAVKYQLPDGHTDFVFSVIGEEFGYLSCAFLVIVYSFLILHNIYKIREATYSLTEKYIIVGVCAVLFFQSFFNIGVNLNILPTKGVTLPFISYGGSSMISMTIAIVTLLTISRKRYNVNLSYNQGELFKDLKQLN